MRERDLIPSLPTWRGRTTWKYPGDFLLYHQEIYRSRPDWIVETGTREGGSTLFFADMLAMINAPGKVLSIDVSPASTPSHGKVQYIQGNSADRSIVGRIKEIVSGKVMVVLDSLHTAQHVWREIRLLAPLVTVRQSMVVEDCYVLQDNNEQIPRTHGPEKAIFELLKQSGNFVREYPEKQFLRPTSNPTVPPVFTAHAVTAGGWLRRVK